MEQTLETIGNWIALSDAVVVPFLKSSSREERSTKRDRFIFMPDTHRRRRRNATVTVELRRVGVGGVNTIRN